MWFAWSLKDAPAPKVHSEIDPPDVAASGRAPSPFGSGPVVTGPDAESPPSADAAAQPTPPGITPEQWDQLQQAFAGHPQRDAELAKASARLAYDNLMQRYLSRRSQGATVAELTPMARQLDAGLDGRVASGDMGTPDALMLKQALLEDLEPNEARREAMLDEWERRHPPR
jgi:hypothetical protein